MIPLADADKARRRVVGWFLQDRQRVVQGNGRPVEAARRAKGDDSHRKLRVVRIRGKRTWCVAWDATTCREEHPGRIGTVTVD